VKFVALEIRQCNYAALLTYTNDIPNNLTKHAVFTLSNHRHLSAAWRPRQLAPCKQRAFDCNIPRLTVVTSITCLDCVTRLHRSHVILRPKVLSHEPSASPARGTCPALSRKVKVCIIRYFEPQPTRLMGAKLHDRGWLVLVVVSALRRPSSRCGQRSLLHSRFNVACTTLSCVLFTHSVEARLLFCHHCSVILVVALLMFVDRFISLIPPYRQFSIPPWGTSGI
jgi:hypothetical protein